MIKEIWKYKFNYTIEMPMDAKILTIQKQDGEPTIWALVNPNNEFEIRNFRIIGTGNPFDDGNCTYIGTFQDGPFVWHVFEDVK